VAKPNQKSTVNKSEREQPGGGNTESPAETEESQAAAPPSVTTSAENSNAASPAPVVHFVQETGALLVDYAHGKGRIVLLSDPFIVANNGIGRADNLQLALNVVVGNGGLIAFDEFHQGHAATHNALFQYFAGTPVLRTISPWRIFTEECGGYWCVTPGPTIAARARKLRRG
jgi:hypothetical protein